MGLGLSAEGKTQLYRLKTCAHPFAVSVKRFGQSRVAASRAQPLGMAKRTVPSTIPNPR